MCVEAGLLLVFPGRSMGGASGPAGKTLHIGCGRMDSAVFESEAPVVSHEELEPLVIFDQSELPSRYETPYQEGPVHRYLSIIRPYDQAVFPRNIAPPKIRWEDQTDNLWMISITAPGWSAPLRVVTTQAEWRPDAGTWEAIKSSGTGEWIDLEVRGCLVDGRERLGDEVYVERRKFRVSPYPAAPLIVYRLVRPLFHGYKTPDVVYRDISTFETRTFLPGAGAFCTNCHSFARNPALEPEDINLAIAVRRNVGENPYRILGLYNFEARAGKTQNVNSFFMGWNPDGTKLAACVGQAIFSRPLITLETQEFFVLRSGICIIDHRTLEVEPLPGASDPDYMETFPTWSPDGKTIIFARAGEMKVKWGTYMPNTIEFIERKFDLYRVPYNDGQGGPITPIPGASNNDMSNYFPRYSPDGKWIVFNKAEYSSLVNPTADLWILSTKEGAQPRELECNTPYSMDSWHSWSSNSRWLLFATKRDDGIFAKIYLTEIDENGHASPPVELPTMEDTLMCYNVPEFLQYRWDIDGNDVLDKVTWH